ncbi:MAG: hypothetical protein EAZ07_08055 [Cytophagales bacterium]|nr:MAG: hypothetical protein EAZ07_08055 [Cytophagales bacterium]
MTSVDFFKLIKKIVFFLLLLWAEHSFAQQSICFENIITGKKIELKAEQLVLLEYKGYLGQYSKVYGTIKQIADSTIDVIVTEKNRQSNFKVHLKDIVAFNKYSKFRLMAEPIINLSVAVASVFLFYSLEQNHPNISFGYRLGLSFGINALSNGITKIAFQKKAKNKLAYGWHMKINNQ